MTKLAAGVLAAMTAWGGEAAGQSIRYVRVDGPSNGDGTSWASAYNKVFKALDEAALNPAITQIWIAQGAHTPNHGGGDRDDTFALVPGVALYGGFGGGETALDQRDPEAHVTSLSGDFNGNDGANFAGIAENARHVLSALNFAAAAAPATLDGLTIRGGNANFDPNSLLGGGGLFIQSAKVVIVDCTFTANSAGINQASIGGFGGAIYDYGGSLDASDCIFVANRGDNGGAFGVRDFNGGAYHASFSGCAFTGNSAANQTGGAVWTGANPFDTVDRDLTFNSCLFEGNKAQYGGAIIEQNTKHVRIADCTFRANQSFVVGGAIWHNQSAGPDQEPMAVTRCVFQDNLGADAGGAVFITAADARFTSCAFLNNKVPGGTGGAIRSGPQFGQSFGAGDLEIYDSEFSGNVAALGGGVAALRNPLAIVTNCSFAQNKANANSGGGLFSQAIDLRVDNSIFWLNQTAGAFDQAAQLLHQPAFGPLTINHSCVQGLTGSLGGAGNIGSDPEYLDVDGPDNIAGTADDDLRPSNRSPVIDLGTGASLPADAADLDGDGNIVEPLPLDLDGDPRVVGRAPDMGAFEVQVDLAPGDVNGDGVVNIDDLFEVINSWGRCVGACPADLTGDGSVDVDDLFEVINHWT